MANTGFDKPEYFTNRELSWLSFNERVLSEARDKTIPMMERLKFLSITASNLDEFFMIRVASLKDMVHAKYTKKDISGMTAGEQLETISRVAHELVKQQYSTYNRSLLSQMKQHGLEVVTGHERLTKEQAEAADRYFEENVYPVLTPMALDSSRPFPLIRNKALNIGALISKKDEKEEDAAKTEAAQKTEDTSKSEKVEAVSKSGKTEAVSKSEKAGKAEKTDKTVK
ncbi:MAG: RNA degradosome polyphosphate kinase, partial [Lachnospiraceae bacterium]|nr:RNA degradosome polyphosphate kinase [Lachnospiraceae bacterium]